MTQIQTILFKYQDEKYGDFIAKLVPTEAREAFIGIRSPCYKKILSEAYELPQSELDSFLTSLPHQYHEENALHISFINGIKDYDSCVAELEKFLPYISNWAISDSLGPAVLEKNKDKIIIKIQQWINDEKPYTKRVGMLLLKKYFLDDYFKTEYLDWAADIRSDEYYVNMMTAWLFADAMIKQWDTTITFIQQNRLDSWTHNKAIQKAIESYRITAEQKEYLRTLKVKVSRKG
ncbi:DNA alkylation repair protein [Treponema sp.]|uniref:DNA alkylation repair protein n=1 Tax=Treponema sp. TaxID=166 RepID=UPI00298E30BB|nr:DNA alkylation repair protein [Treponema sp.]MCQ2242337.1 DNA alkylation repair protein [Treponema sp.]